MIAAVLLAAATFVATAQSGTTPKPATPAPKAGARSNSPANAEFNKVAKDAAAARDAGRLEESIALYQKALRLRPSWAEGSWSLGTAFYEIDKYAEAKEAFARVVRLQPKHAAAFGFKGL